MKVETSLWLQKLECIILLLTSRNFVVDVDESIPVVNESVIEDILHTSQSQPDSLCKTFVPLL